MSMIRNWLAVAVIALLTIGLLGMLPGNVGAQVPPKATATAVLPAPPKAPLPAKTGNAGFHATNVNPFAEASDAAPASGSAIGLAVMVGAVVALIKSAWKGSMDPRVILGLVALVSAGAVYIGHTSGMLSGATPYALVEQWLTLVIGGIGGREALVTLVPAARELPSRA